VTFDFSKVIDPPSGKPIGKVHAVFNNDIIDILKKYGLLGMIGSGEMANKLAPQEPQ
jgi:hypothetical protein